MTLVNNFLISFFKKKINSPYSITCIQRMDKLMVSSHVTQCKANLWMYLADWLGRISGNEHDYHNLNDE